VEWYKDLLRRRTSALQETQSVADAAAATYLQSEEIVVSIQAHQAELNHIHKRRSSVQREVTKAEMIINDLKIMINGTKQQEDRVLSIVDILLSTFDDLTHVGEPPYHRQDRKIADQMCMTVLKVHRESLVVLCFVDSAKEAVTAVQSWFDDSMPTIVQEEIDAILNNSLYQESTKDDVKEDDKSEWVEEERPLVGSY
jgi:septal ring factor EnvC (AmiA/AmiB activator)